MIAAKTVTKVERLLVEDRLSQRKIARLLGVSRGSVAAIAAGRRREYEVSPTPTERELDEPAGPAERCPGCGGLVYLPCLACRLDSRPAGRTPLMPSKGLEQPLAAGRFEVDEMAAFQLRPDHRARYEEVRRWRREHQGQPMEGRP